MTTFYSTLDNVSTTTPGYVSGSGVLSLATGAGSAFGSTFPILVSTVLADGTTKGIYRVSGRTNDTLTGLSLVAGSDANLPAGSFVEIRWTAEHAAQYAAAINAIESSVAGLGTAATHPATDFDSSGAASAVQSNLNTHTGNTSNPHATTAAQVGAYTTAQADTLLAAKLGTTGDGSAVTVTATGESSARSLAAHLADALDVRGFGVVGNGTTDDTAALQSAINAAATAGKWLRAWPGAAFKVSSQGTQTYLGPTGGASSHKIALKIPTGSRIDFMGAKIQGDTTNLDTVLLGNLHTDGSSADVIEIRNLVVDGGARATYGNSGARSEVMAWFRGVDRSRFENITVQNSSYIAGSITAFTNSYCHLLNAKNITGQGWVVGGNTADAFFDCTFGTLLSEDIAQFNPGATSGQPGFSQPGNGHFLSGRRWAADMVATRNASGFKIGPGNQDVTIGRVVADGTVNSGESNNGNDNSGCKVQGDPPVVTGTATASGTNALTAVTTVNGSGTAYAVGQFLYGPQIPAGTTITAVGSGTLSLSAIVPAGTGISISASTSMPPDRISIGVIRASNGYGYGAYLFDAGHVQIGQFLGYKNGRGGTDADMNVTRVQNLEIGTFASEWAGGNAIDYGPGNGVVNIGKCKILNPGDVVGDSSVNGITPASGDTWIDDLLVIDNRSTPIGLQAVNCLSDNVFDVKSFRSNVNAPCRIQYPRHRLGNPYLSVGTNPNWGIVTLTNGSATTNISNAHVKTFDYSGSGSTNPYVQPVVELIPWNAAAQSFGVLSYYVPSNFNLTLKHPGGQLAAGTEQYLWRLVEYRTSTVLLASTAAAQVYAPLASPTFTGTPLAPTASTADNSTKVATTAFVKAQGYGTGGGTVTSVSATVPSGLSVITNTASTTPQVVISTTLNGFVRGNGSGFTAASITTGDLPADVMLTDGAGQTVTSDITFGDGTGNSQCYVNSAAGAVGNVVHRKGGVDRWHFRCDSTAETGSNAGSDFVLIGRSDAGAGIGNYLKVRRSDGLVTIGTATITQAGLFTGSVSASSIPATTVAAGSYTNANLTLGADGRVTAASNGSAGSNGLTVLYKQMADGTVTTTTTETTLVNATGAVGSTAISGLAAGDTVEVECGGTLTSTATPGSLQIKVKFGSFVLDSTSIALTASMTGMAWHARATFVNRTVSGSGSVAGQGEHLRATSTVAGMSAYVLKGTTPSAVANNASVAVDITATFSTNVANTITMAYCTIAKR